MTFRISIHVQDIYFSPAVYAYGFVAMNLEHAEC